jgi:hypothetical protein
VWRLASFLLFAFCSVSRAKDITQSHEDSALFVGSIGCRSSSCHGGAGERRSQYITWTQKDFHTRGYAILLDARSARIGEAAGLPQPQTSARCTVCHSPFASVPSTRLSSNTRVDEGVSCENCHGAAAGWLRGHTRSDWSYGTRVTAGMHDLRSLYVRANACAACHQSLDKDILAAGHPPLVFELDSQCVNEPRHWREDAAQIGPRSWLAGQAVALRESAWHARTDSDPSADSQQNAMALGWLLAKVTLSDPGLPQIVTPDSSDLEPLQKQADGLARHAGDWNPSNEVMMSILRTLGDAHPEFVAGKDRSHEQLLYRGVRVTLAVDRLSTAIGLSTSLAKELALLRQDVQRRYDFDNTVFAEHLRAFRAKL